MQKARTIGAVNTIALIISGGGVLLAGAYVALYNQFNGQVQQNALDIVQVKTEYSALNQKVSDIDQNTRDIKAYIMKK